MDLITQLVERRPNGQESTAAQACLHAANIQASIDRRGRALDNVFRERLSRSVKSENTSLHQYDTVCSCKPDYPQSSTSTTKTDHFKASNVAYWLKSTSYSD